jgi:hypothetical protein
VVFHSHHYSLTQVFRRNFDSGASLLGISEDRFSDMARYELAHLGAGCRSFARRRQWFQIPRFLAFEATRAGGFAAGQREKWLPRRVKRLFSLHRYHW